MSDDFSKAVATVLDDYAESVTEAVQRVAKEVATEGVKRVKANSPVNPQGKKRGAYKSGWTKKVEVTRYGASAVVHNKKFPGLVHLLEKGHATRNGGRTSPQEHVAPVQDWMNEEFEKRITEAIKK